MTTRIDELIPATGDRYADAAGDDARAWLRERYRHPSAAAVRLNMITTLTGAASGGDGTSNTLTSRVDRTILGVIRAEADVIVVGAATVRAEGYLLPSAAHLAVVTRTGDLSGHRFTPDDAARLVLLAPADRVDEVSRRAGLPGARVQAVPAPGGAAEIVRALRDAGYARIVCEGGPTLAGMFADAGVVDEYCVTVAPDLTPAARPFLPVHSRVPTAVAGMLVDGAGFSYLRLRPTPAPAA